MTHIELHVNDFDAVKDFYSNLGFEVVWEREPEGLKGYLVLKKEANIICFWGGNDEINKHSYFKDFPVSTPPGYRVELVLMTEDLEGLYIEAKASNCVVEEIKLQPWGLNDFRIKDPFGFYLRFTEPHNILENKYAVE